METVSDGPKADSAVDQVVETGPKHSAPGSRTSRLKIFRERHA